ncbi:sce7725 family protein [Microbacterium sp. W1N]|uniref:sce7725 family protein n=1 Tax=Microbacterium festucae TaxID=2977531 RepID=UPI0021BF95B9|nr:sce7725 family protein [Microbacterium festucae]MCT9819288.1 sce7725 family protein [Microbacterium festucae]
MYFPYLYGLQSELLALRDLPNTESLARLSPTIDPVKSNPASLRTALSSLAELPVVPAVVINPSLQELRTPAAAAAWWTEIEPTIRSTRATPALAITSSTTPAEIAVFATSFPAGPLRLVVRSGGPIASVAASTLAGREVIAVCHHNVEDSVFVAAFGADKVVRLADSFVRQQRNADYEGVEWFTSSNTSFRGSGRPGFGDYTVLASLPAKPGGGRAGAVAVHASFIHASGDIWVAHYVSDTTDRDEGTTAEKLLEALDKLQVDRAQYLDSAGMRGFDDIHARRLATNLATNKRHQVSHHLVTTLASF